MNDKEQPKARWPENLAEWESKTQPSVETVLGNMVDRAVNLNVQDPRPFKLNEIRSLFMEGLILVTVNFNEGRTGAWHFLIPPNLAALMSDPTVTDSAAEFNPTTHGSPLSEMIAQVVVLLVPEISQLLEADIEVEIPMLSTDPSEIMGRLEGNPVTTWELKVENWGKSFLLKVLEWKDLNADAKAEDDEEVESTEEDVSPESTAEKPDEDSEQLIIKEAMFEDLGDSAKTVSDDQPRNIDILLDINLPITIELGRTSMLVRDVLELGPGSVIELDKLSGEPVDLYVNEKKFAKGEVVVIEENFGIRITELLKLDERLKVLK